MEYRVSFSIVFISGELARIMLGSCDVKESSVVNLVELEKKISILNDNCTQSNVDELVDIIGEKLSLINTDANIINSDDDPFY